jgi:hypothetical protein
VSDDMEITGATPSTTGTAAPEEKPGGIRGFFASTLGKVLLAGCAITALLVIIGTVAMIVLGVGLFSSAQNAAQNAPNATGTPQGVPSSTASGAVAGAPSASSTVSTVPPDVAVVQNRDIFTPRNPFEVIDVPVIPTETVDAVSNVLLLSGIHTDNGSPVAVFQWQGTQYEVGEGETIGTSPWQVIKIYDTNVVLLYGDERVTLQLGQGISK